MTVGTSCPDDLSQNYGISSGAGWAYADSVIAEPLSSHAAITSACRTGLDARGLYDRVAAELVRLVPFDEFCWLGTDPGTLIPISNISGAGSLGAMAALAWELELQTPDVNKFAFLARSPHRVGVLSDATGGELDRSPRYRRLIVPQGFGHELRAALVASGVCWGFLALFRGLGEPDFTAADATTIATLVPHLAAAQRASLLARPATNRPDRESQGVIVLDPSGRVEMFNQAATHWLDACTDTIPDEHDRRLPDVILATAATVRARLTLGQPTITAGSRMRTRAGDWLSVQGSLLSSSDGQPRIAVVLGPAPTSAVIPLLMQAYDLSRREHDVTAAVLAGRTTEEIGTQLFISPYTVQDHLKAVFDKVGVRSRRELIAQLYSRHYLQSPRPHN